jgi:hypothetical protein
VSSRYEVWIDGRMVGKRQSRARTYTHAVVGYGMNYDHTTGEKSRSDKLSVFAFAGSALLGQKQLCRFSAGAKAHVVEVLPVKAFTKVDAEGRRLG